MATAEATPAPIQGPPSAPSLSSIPPVAATMKVRTGTAAIAATSGRACQSAGGSTVPAGRPVLCAVVGPAARFEHRRGWSARAQGSRGWPVAAGCGSWVHLRSLRAQVTETPHDPAVGLDGRALQFHREVFARQTTQQLRCARTEPPGLEVDDVQLLLDAERARVRHRLNVSQPRFNQMTQAIQPDDRGEVFVENQRPRFARKVNQVLQKLTPP